MTLHDEFMATSKWPMAKRKKKKYGSSISYFIFFDSYRPILVAGQSPFDRRVIPRSTIIRWLVGHATMVSSPCTNHSIQFLPIQPKEEKKRNERKKQKKEMNEKRRKERKKTRKEKERKGQLSLVSLSLSKLTENLVKSLNSLFKNPR